MEIRSPQEEARYVGTSILAAGTVALGNASAFSSADVRITGGDVRNVTAGPLTIVNGLTLDDTMKLRSIVDVNLRQRYGVIVVGIQREDRRMEFNPEPDTLMHAGDKLVVLGRPESLKKLEVEALG